MPENKIEIRLTVNDKATKELKNAEEKAKSFGETIKKNWLAITATITAASVAIKKAFDLIKESAKFNQQKEAFRNFAESLGADADEMVLKLREMSAETLSTAQIMQNATRAMALGLDPAGLPKLMEISRSAARAFGEDVGFMFDSIVLGIGRQSRMILDNLGIIVSAETAYKNYADTLGIAADKLDDAQKKQAFFNEVLRQGQDIIDSVNAQNKSLLESIQSFGAFIEDLKIKIGNFLIALVRAWQIMFNVILTTMANLVSFLVSGFETLFNVLNRVIETLDAVASKLPGVDNPLEGLSLTLEGLSEKSREFSEGFAQEADIYAEAAVQIADVMANNVAPSVNLARLRLAKMKAELGETATESKKTGDKISSSLGGALSSTIVQGQKFSQSMISAFKSFATQAIVEITKVIVKLLVLKATLSSLGGFGGIIGGILGLATGGTIGKGGTTLPFPTAATGSTVASGRAVPIIAHEGEVIGTPERLRQSGIIGDGGMTINVYYPNLSSDQDIHGVAEKLGFAFEREVRTAR